MESYFKGAFLSSSRKIEAFRATVNYYLVGAAAANLSYSAVNKIHFG